MHRLDPRAKLVLTVLFLLTATLMPDRAWLAFGVLEGLITVVFARPEEGVIPHPSPAAFQRQGVG